MADFDTVVIGAGAAGMSAAITLAKMTQRVALVESSAQLAPTLSGFKRKGIYFDTGMHYVGELGNGHVLDTYFRFLNIEQKIDKKALPEHGFLGLRSPDLENDFYISPGKEKLKKKLISLDPGNNGPQIEAFLAACRTFWDSSPYLNFQTADQADFKSLLFQEQSTAHVLQQTVQSSKIQTILSYPAILMGVVPHEAPFYVHSLIFNSYLRSAHQIHGGGKNLVKAFSQSIKEHGVNLFTANKASYLQVDHDKRIKTVSLAGGQILKTKNCIYTGNPSQIPQLLDQSVLRPGQLEKLSSMKETISAFIVYARIINCDFSFFHTPNWLILRQKGWLNFTGLETDNGPGCLHISIDRQSQNRTGLIIIAPSNFNNFNLWKSSLTNKRPAAYYEYKQRLQNKLLSITMQEIPELKDNIEPITCSTALTLRDYCKNPHGGLYGIQKSIDQYPVMPMTKIGGFFLAGQGIIAPGVLGALISGIVASAQIVGETELLSTIGKYKCKE